MVRPKRRYTPPSSTAAAVAGLLCSPWLRAQLNTTAAPDRASGRLAWPPVPGYNPDMTSSPPEAVLAALATGILGEAYDPSVPGRMLELLGRTASRRDRDQLLGLLRALDTRAGALVLTGRPAPVSGASAAAAEAVVQRWARGLAPQRRLAAALGPLALLAAYAWPGPARDATGYPGPLGPPPDVPRRLDPLRPEGDQELTCDVVVVGSGAGGGVAAAELARAGLDVVVLEKGDYLAERDFTHTEGDAYRDLYLYAMTLTTDDLACRIVAGSALGGGTVVNYSTSFATPPAVLAEWAATSGVEAFVSGEVEASLEAVAGRVGVTEAQSRPGARDRLLERGQAVDHGHLPGGRRGGGGPAGRRGRRPPGAGRRRPGGRGRGPHRERAPAGRQGPGGGGRRRGDRDPGPAAALRPRRPGRPPPAPAPGHRRHGGVRRAGPLVGGDPPGPLVGTAARPPGALRPRVRDRARAPGAGRGRPALAVGRRPPGADGAVGQPVTGRGAVPRQWRRPGPGRPRRQPPGPLAAQRRRRGPHGRGRGRRRGGAGRGRSRRGVQPPPPPARLPPRRPGRPPGLGRGDPPGRVRRRPRHPGLLPPDGLVPHRHRPGDLGRRPRPPDPRAGRAVRGRRLAVPHRQRRQPDAVGDGPGPPGRRAPRRPPRLSASSCRPAG